MDKKEAVPNYYKRKTVYNEPNYYYKKGYWHHVSHIPKEQTTSDHEPTNQRGDQTYYYFIKHDLPLSSLA